MNIVHELLKNDPPVNYSLKSQNDEYWSLSDGQRKTIGYHAYKKAKGFLNKNGIKSGTIGDTIKKFRGYLHKKDGNQNSYGAIGRMEWLIRLYLSGDHPIVCKSLPKTIYNLPEWRKLRRKVLERYGKKCMKCGSIENTQVDHIKPVSVYPELFLEFDNLQVLCVQCNSQKSNKGEKDYRPKNNIITRCK